MIKSRIECYDNEGNVVALIYLFNDRPPEIKGSLEAANLAISTIQRYYKK